MNTATETKTCGCRCYNGWANWETWNVVVWLQNDQRLNDIMKMFSNYDDLINYLIHELGEPANPDGVLWDLPCINRREITRMMNEE